MKKTIAYKNALLSYHIYGKGTPVILVHGFAETHTIWQNQYEYLKDYCRIIVPDLSGSGESELFTPSGESLSIGELAESIHAIIQNENIQDGIMLGHSMGGYITLSYVEKYCERLKAFGLVHSTAFADNDEKKQNRKKGIEMMETYGSYAFLKTTTPNLFTTAFIEKNAAVVDELINAGKHFKKENLQQYYYAMMNRTDKTSVLENTALPVLFVMGTKDVAAPLKDVLKQVHQPKIAYIHIVEDTAHMSMQEAPLKLNEILKNFINEMV